MLLCWTREDSLPPCSTDLTLAGYMTKKVEMADVITPSAKCVDDHVRQTHRRQTHNETCISRIFIPSSQRESVHVVSAIASVTQPWIRAADISKTPWKHDTLRRRTIQRHKPDWNRMRYFSLVVIASSATKFTIPCVSPMRKMRQREGYAGSETASFNAEVHLRFFKKIFDDQQFMNCCVFFLSATMLVPTWRCSTLFLN